jgi:hypothetical protein
MTDELQNDANESGITLDNGDETTNLESATAESGAELAPATGEDQSKTDDGVQKAINKQHAKFREQERRADELEKERNVLKDKLEAAEAEKGDVEIPPIPDSFDEDFEEKLKLRDEAVTQKARQDAAKESVLDQQTASKEAAKRAEDERFTVVVTNYNAQVTKLGLNAEEVRIAGDTVVQNGIDAQLAEYILGDKDGPLITQYLANNPVVQDELRNLPPIQAAMKIDSVIRPAASTMKPQASNAPDPSDILEGRGAGEQVNPLIKGATFE